MFSKDSLLKDRWLLITCLALSVIYLIPFALGGAYSVDDWLRSDTGNSGWEGNGRPAASIIMAIVSLLPNGLSFFGDNVLQDTYPFSMFLGGMVMVSAGYLLKNVLEVKSNFLAGVIILFPLTNPYWIGNLEFRHDSLIMSVAFFLAVISAMVLKRNNYKRLALSFLTSVACLTIMLMIYQAALNVYMSVTVLIVAVLCINKDPFNDISVHIIKSILSMFVAYAIYSMVINNFVTLSEYTKSHSGILQFSSDSFTKLLDNADGFISLLSDLNNGLYGFCILLLTLSSITFSVLRWKVLGAARSLMLIAFIPLTLFLSAGVLILLEFPVIAGRVMMGFSVFTCFVAATCFKEKFGMAIGAFIIFLNFSFGSVAANAINDQQRYDRFVAQQIVSNLYRAGFVNGNTVHVNGPTLTPEQTLRSMNHAPLLRSFVFSAFSNSNFKYSLLRQYGIRSKRPSQRDTNLFNERVFQSRPALKNNLMDIYSDGSTYSVFIKRN
ncbi:glucosyltransferase domain-containing protein [Enterobacter hormaechei subsp. steigerwaltii]|uniref:glucosyltransferase domain-containing protein n=1 Tax=Enterobacter hormaechei TaxID=158836 RepID=UPI003F41EF94